VKRGIGAGRYCFSDGVGAYGGGSSPPAMFPSKSGEGIVLVPPFPFSPTPLSSPVVVVVVDFLPTGTDTKSLTHCVINALKTAKIMSMKKGSGP
jgi:hypothetical protein